VFTIRLSEIGDSPRLWFVHFCTLTSFSPFMLRILLIFCCVVISGSHAVELVIVDLNKPDTYRAVFDAGLRPRRAFSGGMGDLLEIRPAKKIGFQIGEKNFPPVQAIWEFSIANNDQINVIRGVVDEAWTKAEAFEKTRELEAALGGDVARLKQWIDSYPSPSENGDLWGRRWRSADGTRSVKYYFRHSMQDARPLTISISIELHWPGRKRGFRETPIKPPAGYEHVDISFDETYGGTATTPLPRAPKATDVPTGPGSPSEVRDKAIEPPYGALASSTPWSIIVVLIVAATGLLWLLVKKRK
jgi:hypothetical protein